MGEYMDVLLKSDVFSGIDSAEVSAMLKCLDAFKREYSRGEFILRYGSRTECTGLLLSGSIHIIREDFWGRRDIIAELKPGDTFAESYACTGAPMSVETMANSDCVVLYLNMQRVVKVCPSSCAFHTRLIVNLLSAIARSNLRLNEKLNYVTRRSTREKLLSYLSAQARLASSSTFDIPLNRQQLADFLSVDRSAMSAELSRMRSEGIISFEKNHFTLFKPKEE